MDNKLYLGIDYGGNGVKLGLVDEAGQLAKRASRRTVDLLDDAACRSFANAVAHFVRSEGLAPSDLGGVGLAIPGIAKDGAYSTPNVKADWPRVLAELACALGKDDVSVVNDANAAALGELWKGAGADAKSALLVSIGSGLGAGLVVDGRVVAGFNGAAGELGHVTVVPGGRPCSCGRDGCIERYASARGLVLSFWEEDAAGQLDESLFGPHVPEHDTDSLAVYEAARAGDPRGLRAFAILADKLGFALSQVACMVDPDVFLIAGGLTAAADLYLDDLRAAYRAYAFAACAGTDIRCAVLLDNAGTIGAARFAMQQG